MTEQQLRDAYDDLIDEILQIENEYSSTAREKEGERRANDLRQQEAGAARVRLLVERRRDELAEDANTV